MVKVWKLSDDLFFPDTDSSRLLVWHWHCFYLSSCQSVANYKGLANNWSWADAASSNILTGWDIMNHRYIHEYQSCQASVISCMSWEIAVLPQAGWWPLSVTVCWSVVFCLANLCWEGFMTLSISISSWPAAHPHPHQVTTTQWSEGLGAPWEHSPWDWMMWVRSDRD